MVGVVRLHKKVEVADALTWHLSYGLRCIFLSQIFQEGDGVKLCWLCWPWDIWPFDPVALYSAKLSKEASEVLICHIEGKAFHKEVRLALQCSSNRLPLLGLIWQNDEVRLASRSRVPIKLHDDIGCAYLDDSLLGGLSAVEVKEGHPLMSFWDYVNRHIGLDNYSERG